MVYEPKTEEGKLALANGAEASIVEEMEKEGAIKSQDDDKQKALDVAAQKEADAKAEADKKAAEEAEVAAKGDGKVDEPIDRTPKHMPAWKAKELAKEAAEKARLDTIAEKDAEFKVKLAEAAQKPGGASTDDVDSLAEEFGLKPDVALKMIDRMADIISKKAGLPDIKKSVEENAERERLAKENQGFENEWLSKATTESIAEAGGTLTQEVKDKVKELAYSTTYAKYGIADIIKLNASTLFPADPKEKRTVERGRGGAGRAQSAKAVTDMTSEELDGMSDDEFLKASNDLGKSDSKYKFKSKR